MRPHPPSPSPGRGESGGRGGQGVRSAWLLALLLAAALPAAAREIRVEASLEPPVIGLEETATLTLVARTDSLDANPHFRPDFELENLQIVAGPFRSEDVSYVNGAISRSFRIAFRVRPLAVGKARAHSIALLLPPGQRVELEDRTITVQAEPTRPTRRPMRDPRFEDPIERLMRSPFDREMARRPPRDPAVHLRAELTPTNPWAGQQVLYTLYLYTRDDISAIMPRELPTFRGFWTKDIPLPPSARPEMVDLDGVRHARVVLFQKALFPLRAGRYTIEPAKIELVARVIEPRVFGPSYVHSETARLSTAPQVLDVRPLPASAPPGFAGAVGRLGLTARLDRAELRLGEAATLTVKLSGPGNLQGVAEPKITLPAGLTLLPPQQQAEDSLRGTTVTGERTWTYAVVPDRPGSYTVHVPEIPYFDPAGGAYRIAAAPQLPLHALPRLPPAGPPAAPRHTAALAGGNGAFALGSRLALWLGLPGGIALLLLLARRRRGTAQPGGLPAEACETLERCLGEARGETRPRQAAARLEEAWRELLALQWEIPSGTPPLRWGEAVAARGGDPAVADELQRLAEELTYLRHAPQLSETASLIGEALDRSHRLLRRLR